MATLRRSLYRIQNYIEDLNPLVICFVIAFFITVPIVIYTDTGSEIQNKILILNSAQNTDSKHDSTFYRGCVDTNEYLRNPMYVKQNATFVMLTRNEELYEVISTIESIESHFNQWFHYPYVFLNNDEFTDEFQNAINEVISSQAYFGLVDPQDWDIPIDEADRIKYEEHIEDQGDRGIYYGNLETYHKMCRYYSGKFYQHELVSQFEWYWRIEPNVEFFCDLSYDPFLEMSKHGKKYAFTIVIPEIYWTVPNLFRSSMSYIKEKNITVGSLWKMFTYDYNILDVETEDEFEDLARWVNYESDIMGRISEKVAIDYIMETPETYEYNLESLRRLIDRAQSKVPIVEDKFENQEYNLCHFWSNFEIAKVDIFNNDIYNDYFKFLEEQHGFWEERWGDAPVHSLGLSLVLNVTDVHYFRDIGYRHSTLQHCPKNAPGMNEFKYEPNESRWNRRGKYFWNSVKYDRESEVGSGCRCRCPKMREVEDNNSLCLNKWLDLTHLDDPNLTRKATHNPKEIFNSIRKDFIKDLD
ncbi:hypothetical protein KAFR_0H03220 [Kazachstania africana CBS 2517]|uniref:Mannosyltransferase n=1 Tax=Kazachstania africana (strain ATCC 22294 / BCRC 22015 / CBS 2517 / CECT 1963 / NBRC 1671 / NRRL Y-8276) TaxID=1071382 RepID=H2AZH6_KAZAF|nr:hypothetical protein KAFR_0H03220 [Kazachstania africana CBS 2517]CCF59732.1 hypothetical protein KAFR_0H03220 [Kazachstania africana CBS 2517]